MSVYHSKTVVVIFLCNITAWILTKRADFVFKRLGISYQLGFIQRVVDLFHYLVAHFNAYAYVNSARLMLDIVRLARSLKPIRPSPASGYDNSVGKKQNFFFSFFDNSAFAYVVFKIDLIRIIYGLLRQLSSYKVRQVSSDVGTQ